jgi:hypothetical protein
MNKEQIRKEKERKRRINCTKQKINSAWNERTQKVGRTKRMERDRGKRKKTKTEVNKSGKVEEGNVLDIAKIQ